MKASTPTLATDRCRGFTLLEILLVCVLIALAAGLTTSFLSGSDQKQFTVGLSQISAVLRNARRQAIVTGIEQEVRLTTAAAEEPAPGSPPAEPPDWFDATMRLSYAATLDESLEETPALAMTFFPMGSSTGGLIELADSERRSYLYVSPFTGQLISERRLSDLEDRVREGRP